jgi:ribonuclease HII
VRIAGIDEAGRGALAGPVVAGAVVLPLDRSAVRSLLEARDAFPGVNDSKVLTREQRECAQSVIREVALDIGVGIVPAQVVDDFGLSCAGQLAFWRAVSSLKVPPDFVLVDGFPLWSPRFRQLAVIDGDACSASIAAASIIAKVTRDAIMIQMDETLPGYGFAQNVGYSTPAHKRALKALGPSAQHRMRYAPVALAFPSLDE